jgi:hypothetical protein
VARQTEASQPPNSRNSRWKSASGGLRGADGETERVTGLGAVEGSGGVAEKLIVLPSGSGGREEMRRLNAGTFCEGVE